MLERAHAGERFGHPVDGQASGADGVTQGDQRDLGGRAAIGQPVVGDERHVHSRLQRQYGRAIDAVPSFDRPHAQVVADHESAEAEVVTEQPGDGPPRQRRRIPAVEAPVEDVRGHDAVGESFAHQRAIGQQLDRGIRGGGHVHEAVVRVGEARAVAGEVLERGEDARAVHAPDPGGGEGGHVTGVGAEAAAVGDDHRVRGVVADVDDRRQVPVDAGVAQHPPDAQPLQLGEGEIVARAELAGGQRRRVAGVGTQPHDLTALGVDGDQQRRRAAVPRDRARPLGEPGDLRRIDDVPPEQQDAPDAHLADQPLQIRFGIDFGSPEPDE